MSGRKSKRRIAGVAAALLFFAAAAVSPPSARARATTQSLEAEIERLKIIIDFKQQRIEALERQIAELRAKVNAGRYRKIVGAIQREVERLRGLRAKRPVEAAPLTDEVLRRLIEKEFAERYTAKQLEGEEALMKHFGLIPPDMDLKSFLESLYREQIAGLYDDETKKLYVSDKFDPDNTITKVILAHEICHALQDQYFNLTSSPIHLKTNDDRALAALCVIEGDATLLMSDYLGEHLSWKILLELPGVMMMDQQQLASAPPVIVNTLLFPYTKGMYFVAQAVLDRGPRVRNALFRRYPRSTEQVLHPRKYFGPALDEPTEISLDSLTSSGLIPTDAFYDNVCGEFGIQDILGAKLAAWDAERAAAGWDGDRIVFGRGAGGAYGLAWLSVWDSEDDAREFADALVRWLEARRPGAHKATSPDEKTVRLDDRRGWAIVAVEGDRVACAEGESRDRAERILAALRSVKIKRVP